MLDSVEKREYHMKARGYRARDWVHRRLTADQLAIARVQVQHEQGIVLHDAEVRGMIAA